MLLGDILGALCRNEWLCLSIDIQHGSICVNNKNRIFAKSI